MNILAFDTCFESCSVAVAAGPIARHVSRFERMQSGQAERLMPMIDEVMSEAGLNFGELDRIAVTVGPGTFTGMRIGIAAARALALSLSTPIVTFSSFEVMSRDPDFDADAGEIRMIAADARRGQVYVQDFGAAKADAPGKPQLLTIAQAAALGGEAPLLVAGSGGGLIAAAAGDIGRAVRAILPQLQPRMEHVLAEAAVREPTSQPPRPLYLRPPDAKPQGGKSLLRSP